MHPILLHFIRALRSHHHVDDFKQILIPKLDPLEQQRVWICNLKHSSEQAEEALSLGLGHLHLSLTQIIAGRSLCDGIGDGEYMNLMAAALGKLVDFEEFVSQVFPSIFL